MLSVQRAVGAALMLLAVSGCVFEASRPLDDGLVQVGADRFVPASLHFVIRDAAGAPEAAVVVSRVSSTLRATIVRRPGPEATTLSSDSFTSSAIFAVPGADGLYLARRGTTSVSYLAFRWSAAGRAWIDVPRTLPASERSTVNRMNPLTGGAIAGFSSVRTQEALLTRVRLIAERPAYVRPLTAVDAAAHDATVAGWRAQVEDRARVARDLFCAPLRTTACLVEGQACRRLDDGRMIYATVGGHGWYFRDGRRVPPALAGNRECPVPGGG